MGTGARSGKECIGAQTTGFGNLALTRARLRSRRAAPPAHGAVFNRHEGPPQMPTSRFRRLTRERRRIALVTGLVLAGALLARAPGSGLAFSALLAVAFGLAVGVLSVVRPSLRGYGEAIGLASFAFGTLAWLSPGSALDLTGADGRVFVSLSVWVALVALLRRGRRALGALPLPRRRNVRLKTRATSPLALQQLWHGLVPVGRDTRPGNDPALAAVEDMSLRLGRVRLMTQPATDLAAGPRLQILEVEPPFHIRLRADGRDPRALIDASGESEIFLVDLGATRLVLFSHSFRDLPLGRALLAWLDDAPGRMLDRRLTEIERAHREDRAWRTPTLAPVTGRDGTTATGDARAETLAAWEDDARRDDASSPRASALPAQDPVHADRQRRAS